MLRIGRSEVHTAGRSGFPKSAHRPSGVSWMHGVPAGLPCGIPGIGELIESAMQHAAQPTRHSIGSSGTGASAADGITR
ncbi:MAG TPA: hypothetical protein VMM36_18660 [Opitutaceae bacterium]|nr:hypothetical protein [Opitutaceae bacterium]